MRRYGLIGLLLCVVCASPCIGQKPDTLGFAQWGQQFKEPHWKFFSTFTGDSGARVYYDTATIERVGPGVWRVWAADLYSRFIPASGDISHLKSHTLRRLEVRCLDHTLAMVSLVEYNGGNTVAQLTWDATERQWMEPPPGSIMAKLVETVCSGRSLR
jgi:hypothetical protein